MDIIWKKTRCLGKWNIIRNRLILKRHAHGKLYYGGKWHEVEFFAFLHADAYDSVLYNTQLQKETDTLMYLDYVRQNASYFEELSFQKSERFVTLSTCTSDSTNWQASSGWKNSGRNPKGTGRPTI